LPKVKLVLCYNGEAFFGSQKQAGAVRTVASVLENAIERLYEDQVNLVFSGRTDSGVHADGQVVSFEAKNTVPVGRLQDALNGLLPEDLQVKEADYVDEKFCARFSATRRRYQYLFSETRIPMTDRTYVASVGFKPQGGLFEAAGRILIGRHDFRNFGNTGSNAKTTVRHVETFRFETCERNELHNWNQNWRLHRVTIEANGFLYRMVRNIMGAVFEIHKGRLTLDDFRRMIYNQCERLRYVPAPPEGLTLSKVSY